MSTVTKITAIVVVWIAAGAMLLAVGRDIGQRNRWSGCDEAWLDAELVRVCHTGAFLKVRPTNVPRLEPVV